MSNLHKRLLLIGAPLALMGLLIFLLSGERSKTSIEFEGIGEISDMAIEIGDRYDIASKAKRELELPQLNLAFLENDFAQTDLAATTAELPRSENAAQPISPSGLEDELNGASPSSTGSETETEIPLSPPVSSRKSSSGSLQDNVIMATFENESGNDFPLTPPSASVSPANAGMGIPQVLAPSQRTATPAQEPTRVETQSTGKDAAALDLTTESSQVASLASARQAVSVAAQEDFPVARQIQANAHREAVPSDQLLLAKSTTLPPAISTQIRQRLDYGTSLARRGAFASAEEIYFQVIRLIAETKDSQVGAREHTIRLANGLTALEEAEDFITSDLKTRVRINVENIIQGHNTTVLQSEDVSGMTSIQALQRYYEYAGELIAGACDNEPVGSEALYFLGKLYATDTQYDPTNSAMRNAKSMIMQQAALEANAMNYRAANELGVLLAQYGRFDDAKEMLIHSVATYPDQIAWKNLACVHEKLGETQLAGLAFKESKIAADEAAQRKTAEAHGPIQWVDPEVFVRTGGDRQEFVDSATPPQPGERQQETNPREQNSAAGRTAKTSSERWKIWKR